MHQLPERLKPEHRPAPRLDARFLPSRIPRSKPRSTPEPLSNDEDGLEKTEMSNTRPILENAWYQCYDWLINHIPESMIKPKNITTQNFMRTFELKVDNIKPTDFKPTKIRDAFEC